MNWTFVVVYAHWVGAVLFVGYFLFWAILTTATWRESSGASAERLLQAAKAAAWPLPGYKLSLPLIGWLLLIVITGSGLLSIMNGPSIQGSFSVEIIMVLWAVKTLLLVALVVCMPRLGTSRPPVAMLALVLALLIVVVSAQMIR